MPLRALRFRWRLPPLSCLFGRRAASCSASATVSCRPMTRTCLPILLCEVQLRLTAQELHERIALRLINAAGRRFCGTACCRRVDVQPHAEGVVPAWTHPVHVWLAFGPIEPELAGSWMESGRAWPTAQS